MHIQKGRGAQLALNNRFSELNHELRDDYLNHCMQENETVRDSQTIYKEVFPKSIVNKITSPDVGMAYSMNPYQGCEHGCIYCYARNTHEFWGYGPGLDFESRILVKRNAARLLEDKIRRKSWEARTIVMSGNTDCYQPAERSYKITRECLEVFLRYRHPVGIITKNALVLRDIDLINELNNYGLISVSISITSLSEKTRRLLEPRTATIKKRLNTVKKLSQHGIPVNVMMAPIIPSINSHEILKLAKAAADAGAMSVGHTMVRLNGAIGLIFYDWIKKHMPGKANRVMRQIESCHGGNLNDSRFGVRMRGEGKIADQINDMMGLAKRKYFKNCKLPVLNTDLHELYKDDQLKLF